LLVVLFLVVRRLAVAAAADDSRQPAGRFQLYVLIRLLILSCLAIFALTFRYDLFPTLLAAAGLLPAIDDRPVAGGVAYAFGIMAKVFPIVLVPVAGLRWLIDQPATLWRYGAAILVGTAAVAAPFVAISGGAVSQVFSYQADRGLQL